MPCDTSLDVIRFATLMKEGRCSEDDIRRAILSRKVKPLFHVDELSTPFMRWAEDGSTFDDPIVDDDADKPYELFNGYVCLEINRALGFLDCDFHRFTKATDVDAGLCPLPQFSLVEHVSMEDVIRHGGLTKSDAELLEQPMQRTDANDKVSSIGPVVTESASNAAAPKFHMTKAALIAAHEHEWPTIASDIHAAKKNGLDAAKAGSRGWWETYALDWARANGKLEGAAKSADSLTQAMRNMGSLPGRKHTLEG